MSVPLKYPLPAFLTGIMTPKAYSHWVVSKAYDVRHDDILRNKRFARDYSETDYGNLIHEAAVRCLGVDPFTGEALRFDLVNETPRAKARGIFSMA
jgi:hypothetical protein